MSFLDKLNGAFSQATTQAKKTYNAARLDLKIKTYTKEKTEIYISLGKLLYASHRQDISDQTVEELCCDVDHIKHRLNMLEKQLSSLKDTSSPSHFVTPEKSEEKQEPNKEASKEPKKFPRLNKKETDLTITRTKDGIQILRFCPNCHAENNPHTPNCSNCDYTFK